MFSWYNDLSVSSKRVFKVLEHKQILGKSVEEATAFYKEYKKQGRNVVSIGGCLWLFELGLNLDSSLLCTSITIVEKELSTVTKDGRSYFAIHVDSFLNYLTGRLFFPYGIMVKDDVSVIKKKLERNVACKDISKYHAGIFMMRIMDFLSDVCRDAAKTKQRCFLVPCRLFTRLRNDVKCSKLIETIVAMQEFLRGCEKPLQKVLDDVDESVALWHYYEAVAITPKRTPIVSWEHTAQQRRVFEVADFEELIGDEFDVTTKMLVNWRESDGTPVYDVEYIKAERDLFNFYRTNLKQIIEDTERNDRNFWQAEIDAYRKKNWSRGKPTTLDIYSPEAIQHWREGKGLLRKRRSSQKEKKKRQKKQKTPKQEEKDSPSPVEMMNSLDDLASLASQVRDDFQKDLTQEGIEPNPGWTKGIDIQEVRSRLDGIDLLEVDSETLRFVVVSLQQAYGTKLIYGISDQNFMSMPEKRDWIIMQIVYHVSCKRVYFIVGHKGLMKLLLKDGNRAVRATRKEAGKAMTDPLKRRKTMMEAQMPMFGIQHSLSKDMEEAVYSARTSLMSVGGTVHSLKAEVEGLRKDIAAGIKMEHKHMINFAGIADTMKGMGDYIAGLSPKLLGGESITMIEKVIGTLLTLWNFFRANNVADKTCIMMQYLTITGSFRGFYDQMKVLFEFVDAFYEMSNDTFMIAQAPNGGFEKSTEWQARSENVFAAILPVVKHAFTKQTFSEMKLDDYRIKRLHSYLGLLKSAFGVGKFIFSMFREAFYYTWELLTETPFEEDEAKKVLEEAVAFIQDCETMLMKDVVGDAKSDHVLVSQVEQLVYRGKNLAELIAKVPAMKNNLRSFYEAYFQIKVVHHQLDVLRTSQKARNEPFCVQFGGPPGCGKSKLAPLYAKFQMEATNREFTANTIYKRAKNSKHWNAYMDNPVTLYDDVWQSTDPTVIRETGEELIDVINVTPCPLEMADIESKGKTNMISDVIILTSNLPFIYKDCTGLQCEMALRRRVHCAWYQTTKRTLKQWGKDLWDPHAKGLFKSKEVDPREWMFMRYDMINDTIDQTRLYTFDEMLVETHKEYCRHFSASNFVEKLIANKTMFNDVLNKARQSLVGMDCVNTIPQDWLKPIGPTLKMDGEPVTNVEGAVDNENVQFVIGQNKANRDAFQRRMQLRAESAPFEKASKKEEDSPFIYTRMEGHAGESDDLISCFFQNYTMMNMDELEACLTKMRLYLEFHHGDAPEQFLWAQRDCIRAYEVMWDARTQQLSAEGVQKYHKDLDKEGKKCWKCESKMEAQMGRVQNFLSAVRDKTWFGFDTSLLRMTDHELWQLGYVELVWREVALQGELLKLRGQYPSWMDRRFFQVQQLIECRRHYENRRVRGKEEIDEVSSIPVFRKMEAQCSDRQCPLPKEEAERLAGHPMDDDTYKDVHRHYIEMTDIMQGKRRVVDVQTVVDSGPMTIKERLLKIKKDVADMKKACHDYIVTSARAIANNRGLYSAIKILGVVGIFVGGVVAAGAAYAALKPRPAIEEEETETDTSSEDGVVIRNRGFRLEPESYSGEQRNKGEPARYQKTHAAPPRKKTNWKQMPGGAKMEGQASFPKKGPKVKMEAESSIDVKDYIRHVIAPNAFTFGCQGDDGTWRYCQGQFLYGRTFISVCHLFELMFTGNKAHFKFKFGERIYRKDQLTCWLDSEQDVAICTIQDKELPMARNIIHHLVRDDDLDASIGTHMTYVTKEDDGTFFNSVVTQPRYVKDIEYKYSPAGALLQVGRGVKSVGDSKGGDCGAWYVVHNTTFNRKLLGIHVAGGHGNVLCSIVTYEYVMEILNELMVKLLDKVTVGNVEEKATIMEAQDGVKVVIEPITEQNKDELPFELPEGLMDNIKIVGICKEPKRSMPTRTQLRHSPIYGELSSAILGIDTEEIPAQLAPKMNPDGQWVYPMRNAFLKVNRQNIFRGDEDLLRNIGKEIFFDMPRLFEPRVLSVDEALNGIKGGSYFDPIKISTSAGFPYNTQHDGRGKTAHVERVPAKEQGKTRLRLKAHMAQTVEDLENLLRKGEVKFVIHNHRVIWCDNLKDERLPWMKVFDREKKTWIGNTRLMSSAPLELLILMRKYFGAFVENVMLAHNDWICCLGINPFSHEWKILYDKLGRFGFRKNIIAGDFSKFDATIKRQLSKIVFEIIENWYMEGDDWCEEDYNVRLALEELTHNATHILGNLVYQVQFGNPSGQLLTTIENSIVVYLLFIYAALVTSHKKGYKWTIRQIMNMIEIGTFGDDHVAAIAEELQKVFNGHDFAAVCKDHFDMTYTSLDKVSPLVDFTELSRVAFLARNFVVDGGLVTAPLEIPVLLDMLNWVTVGVLTKEQCFDAVCDSFLHELFHHGRKIHDDFRDQLNKARREKGFDVKHSSYDSLLSDFLGYNGSQASQAYTTHLGQYWGDVASAA